MADGGTIILYAQWTINTGYIKFDANTGTGTMDDVAIRYDDDGKYLPDNTYTKTGYEFCGWNTEADGSGEEYWSYYGDIKELLANNNNSITLYAQWVDEDSYIIDFVQNYYEDNFFDFRMMPKLVMKKDEEKALPANTFIRKGYSFSGWNSSSNGDGFSYEDGQVIKNLAGISRLYAQWVPNVYKVKFDANSGTGTPMGDLSMAYDETKSLPENSYTKKDYIFTGWNTKSDGSGTTYTDKQTINNLATANNDVVTLYAQWIPNVTIQGIPAQVYTGQPIEPPLTVEHEEKLLKPGVDYDVVYSDNTQPGTAKAAVIFKGDYAGTTTVEFIIKTINYTIKFNPNGANIGIDDLPMVSGIAKPLPAYNSSTIYGKTFLGWNTKSDGSGTAYYNQQIVNNLTTVPNGTVTLYAQWIDGDYVILFDANTGTGTMDALGTGFSGEISLPANAFAKRGYTFSGWNTEADGSGIALTDQQRIRGGGPKVKVLYAQWEKDTTPSTYTIKFDANTGMGTMEDLAMTYDVEKGLPTNTFTKESNTFIGWNTEADGSGTGYTNEQVVKNLTDTNEGTVTLYAQWEQVQAQKEITIDAIPAQTYTGKAIEPTLAVKADGTPLTIDQDYDVQYTDNIQPGIAKATVTFKGGYAGTEAKIVEFTIKEAFNAKGLWVSKHENTYVTFNWTGTPNNSLATAWDAQYRTKQIGTQYTWSKWISSSESGNTLSKRVYLKPNYTIEFKVKHETDTAYLRSVFTTPAGGKYQSITQCQVKVTAAAGGATFKKGNAVATALKVGTNINGDSGNVITIKKGQSIKITPNHIYPRTNYSMYPRLYPNHAWYDVTDDTKVSLTGTASTAGMKDGAVTIKGLNAGTTTIKITSCNGRGATLTIVVK